MTLINVDDEAYHILYMVREYLIEGNKFATLSDAVKYLSDNK